MEERPLPAWAVEHGLTMDEMQGLRAARRRYMRATAELSRARSALHDINAALGMSGDRTGPPMSLPGPDRTRRSRI